MISNGNLPTVQQGIGIVDTDRNSLLLVVATSNKLHYLSGRQAPEL